MPRGFDRKINPGCLKEKKQLYSLHLIKQLPSLMQAAVSPSSEFARWRANGLQGSFAPTVIARLEDIVRYIADDHPATASTFAMHLLDRAELLSEFPELGTPYRKRKNVRRLRCDPYFIYYRVHRENRPLKLRHVRSGL